MDRDRFCEDCDNDSLHVLLMRVSHMYFASSYEQLTAKGLHPGQLPMLRLLSKRGGLSQREIAQTLHVKPPSVAVSIRRMENAGLLVRTPYEKDQRITRISLSPKGWDKVEAIQDIFKSNHYLLFRGFTESEVCLMRRFLQQIIDNMEEMNRC